MDKYNVGDTIYFINYPKRFFNNKTGDWETKLLNGPNQIKGLSKEGDDDNVWYRVYVEGHYFNSYDKNQIKNIKTEKEMINFKIKKLLNRINTNVLAH